MKYILSLLIILSFVISNAATPDSISVIVWDENELGVSGALVLIEGNPEFTTDNSGKLIFLPKKKLKFPFDMEVKKADYEMEEFMFYEAEKEIIVRMSKIEKRRRHLMIKLVTGKDIPMSGVLFSYNGKNFTTDSEGQVRVNGLFDEKLIVLKGFKIEKAEFSSKELLYTIHVSPSIEGETKVADNKSVKTSDSGLTAANVESPIKDKTLLEEAFKEKVFQEYSLGFDNLSKEIVDEQKRLLENNRKIRNEIRRMTDKLKNEKDLTDEQRQRLKEKIDELERNLIENALAYNQAEKKTIAMVQDLKLLVMQKDSLNALTLSKLKLEEEKRVAAEMKNKRTVIIFTIISISLTFLAIAFYSIARKMRDQKNALKRASEEVMLLKKKFSEFKPNL